MVLQEDMRFLPLFTTPLVPIQRALTEHAVLMAAPPPLSFPAGGPGTGGVASLGTQGGVAVGGGPGSGSGVPGSLKRPLDVPPSSGAYIKPDGPAPSVGVGASVVQGGDRTAAGAVAVAAAGPVDVPAVTSSGLPSEGGAPPAPPEPSDDISVAVVMKKRRR